MGTESVIPWLLASQKVLWRASCGHICTAKYSFTLVPGEQEEKGNRSRNQKRKCLFILQLFFIITGVESQKENKSKQTNKHQKLPLPGVWGENRELNSPSMLAAGSVWAFPVHAFRMESDWCGRITRSTKTAT